MLTTRPGPSPVPDLRGSCDACCFDGGYAVATPPPTSCHPPLCGPHLEAVHGSKCLQLHVLLHFVGGAAPPHGLGGESVRAAWVQRVRAGGPGQALLGGQGITPVCRAGQGQGQGESGWAGGACRGTAVLPRQGPHCAVR
jgi:hypothetical protein